MLVVADASETAASSSQLVAAERLSSHSSPLLPRLAERRVLL
jgi:hypothetical protein